MNKKAVIFTWCHDNGPVNYGQILQCYAMQKLCEKYGLDATVIKYRRLRKFEDLINIPAKGTERNKYELQFKEKYVEKQDARQVKKFQNFISEHICLSAQCYSIKDIEEEIEDKDILIVGSDQLWNPLWFDPVYLLEFAKETQRIVSIATGGISVDKEAYRPTLRRIAKGIEKFDYVSVREPISRDILNAYTKREIADVLDPTLLLDEIEWNQICGHNLMKEKYIFVYCLGALTFHKHILKEIARKYGVGKIIYIKMHYSTEPVNHEGILEPITDAGPKEYLSYIRYAEAVCTDSFHGFVFSVMFKKDFYLMDRAYIPKDEVSNSRADNLMDKLKIKKRYANCKKDLSEMEHIDYERVGQELGKQRKDSIKEFEKAIGIV